MAFDPSDGACALDVTNSTTGTTQNPSLTLTSVVANALIIGALGSGDRDTPTGGTNFTLLHTFEVGTNTMVIEP